MNDLDAALDRLRGLHDRLDQHDAQRETLMRERDQAMRDAKVAGATYDAIRAATGLANAAITTALRRAPNPREQYDQQVAEEEYLDSLGEGARREMLE